MLMFLMVLLHLTVKYIVFVIQPVNIVYFLEKQPFLFQVFGISFTNFDGFTKQGQGLFTNILNVNTM